LRRSSAVSTVCTWSSAQIAGRCDALKPGSLEIVRFDASLGGGPSGNRRWNTRGSTQTTPRHSPISTVGTPSSRRWSSGNAKAEGIGNRPTCRDAFERRRCLVPVDNFYEWKKTATGNQPYAVALADRSLMALAGLWENWRSPESEWVRSFAVITTKPNELCAEVHSRMPVVLGPETWPAWLGEEPADPRQLKALLAPYPSEAMTCWPVSPRVGNVRNNDPSLIEPISPQ
jgi:putative SOS response-associated peptidase YedK